MLGPGDSERAIHRSVGYAVITGWLHGARTALHRPMVAGTLVRNVGSAEVGGMGTAALFVAATGIGSFLATTFTLSAVRRWGRYATANGALTIATVIEFAGAGLYLPMMVICGFFLGAASQVVKLCGDSAIQLDVDDALRGHVFAIQDSLFWVSFVGATTVAAAVIHGDGHSPPLALGGAVLYLAGLAAHSGLGHRSSLLAPSR